MNNLPSNDATRDYFERVLEELGLRVETAVDDDCRMMTCLENRELSDVREVTKSHGSVREEISSRKLFMLTSYWGSSRPVLRILLLKLNHCEHFGEICTNFSSVLLPLPITFDKTRVTATLVGVPQKVREISGNFCNAWKLAIP